MHPMPSHFTVWPTLPYEKIKIKKKKCQKCQTKKEEEGEEESRIKYNLLMPFKMTDFTATTTTTSLTFRLPILWHFSSHSNIFGNSVDISRHL
jgi:hypothetical protein